jgi:hypothetical protein
MVESVEEPDESLIHSMILPILYAYIRGSYNTPGVAKIPEGPRHEAAICDVMLHACAASARRN